MMRSICGHAAALDVALVEIHQSDQLSDIYSYLRIATGLAVVDFHKPAPSSPPMGASIELPPGLALRLATSWSRFSAVWFALQAYDKYWSRGRIDEPVELEDSLPERLRPGRAEPDSSLQAPPPDATPIDRLCYKIARAYTYALPSEYENCLKRFKELGAILGDQPLPPHVGHSSEGLYWVDQIRDGLAHWHAYETTGDEPDPEDPASHTHVMLIDTATQLVLMSMQMMTLCIFPAETQIETYSFDGFEVHEPIYLADAMMHLHLTDFGRRMEDLSENDSVTDPS